MEESYENLDYGLQQVQKCGYVKPVVRISGISSWRMVALLIVTRWCWFGTIPLFTVYNWNIVDSGVEHIIHNKIKISHSIGYRL
jgi:hypothetical protein